jgi:hypothetical protein
MRWPRLSANEGSQNVRASWSSLGLWIITTETVHVQVAPAFGPSLSLDIARFSRSLGAPALSLTSRPLDALFNLHLPAAASRPEH